MKLRRRNSFEFIIWRPFQWGTTAIYVQPKLLLWPFWIRICATYDCNSCMKYGTWHGWHTILSTFEKARLQPFALLLTSSYLLRGRDSRTFIIKRCNSIFILPQIPHYWHSNVLWFCFSYGLSFAKVFQSPKQSIPVYFACQLGRDYSTSKPEGIWRIFDCSLTMHAHLNIRSEVQEVLQTGSACRFVRRFQSFADGVRKYWPTRIMYVHDAAIC